MLKYLLLLVLLLTPVTAFADQSAHNTAVARLTPPTGRLLHGIYPGGVTGYENDITLALVKEYERAVGKRVAWVYFSHNWFQGHAFPTETSRWILAHGSTPYVRLMMRSDTEQFHREPTYKLSRIARGDFDADIAAWGRAAAALNTPILAEFGTEMNGEWFQWNARWNGRHKGAERFRDAYRHIIDVTRAAGADNIVWVFHANNGDYPAKNWNRLEAYYPGDDYIDWLAVSTYGMLAPGDEYRTDFSDSFGQTYARLVKMAPSKPVIVAEFGTDINNPHEPAAAWADKALTNIIGGRWPAVIGFSWWNETWQNNENSAEDTDLRVQNDPALAQIFRNRLARARLITRR